MENNVIDFRLGKIGSSTFRGKDTSIPTFQTSTSNRVYDGDESFQSQETNKGIVDTKSGDDMATENWIRALIQKMDDDQKEAERRHREDIQRSEERFNKLHGDIKETIYRIEDKLDAITVENKQTLMETKRWTIGIAVSIIALGVALFIGLMQIAQNI